VEVVELRALHVFGRNIPHVFIIADVATYFEVNAVGMSKWKLLQKMDGLIINS
jgi:hypothetical protein